jgi:predicted phosphoadenosine phosphosulfate sulfurtransferase
MGDRVPGAKTAARYARGTLYGAGVGAISAEDLRENESWEMRIMQLLDKYPEEQKRWVTKHLMGFIERHYKKTTDPILVKPHPVTGVGWKILHKIAEKGDFKSRVVPRLTTEKSKIRPAMIRQYAKELKEVKGNEPATPTD